MESLNKLFETFTKDFIILYSEATQLEDAFVIFETLNARGKDLEAADLLKNYLFGSVKKDVNTAQKQWLTMIDNLNGVDTTKYIRALWNSSHQQTTERTLYRTIRQTITSPKASKQFLKDLEDYSTVYHDVIFPEESSSFEDKALIKSLKNLRILGASTFYPLILSLKKQNFMEGEIAKIVSKIEVLYFRNNTICRKTSNEMERFFAQLAQKVSDETYDSTDEIQSEIIKQMVDDSSFEAEFLRWSSKSTEVIRYILSVIHTKISGEETTVNDDNSVVHVEHIMPKNNNIWKVDEEIHAEYLWRLGNLALMQGKANIKQSNKQFKEKKKIYKDSKIQPNPDVYEYKTWGEEQIEDKQKKLYYIAKEIWKI